ncbi:uncharacterized protein LOC141525899 [Cotesia typhae]|uniref:uncharacterized protein LOC141525899 n=1 Tax=Cotesia typhae TaxID=2053667 RepID=UPI003D693324
MLDNLKKFSSVPFLTPSQIYESAVSNDTTAAELYPYTKQRSTIKYLRSKSQPNLVHLPKHDRTLHGFWRSLVAGKLDGQLKYGDKKEFELTIHLENVTTKKNETATNLFIYDHDLLESVSRDHIDIHVDATFRCPPHFIDSSVQLLTVMIKIKNVSTHCDKPIPCMMILMSNKEEECYTNVFSYIKKEFPTFKPQSYMSDFEKGLHNAIERNFPEIMPRHYYFHFAQALFRKAKKLGLISKKKKKNCT